MDLPDFSHRKMKPEYDVRQPGTIFSYAAEKQRWLRQNLASSEHLGDAMYHLAYDLNKYMDDTFDSAPELVVTSSDVYYTRSVRSVGSEHTIQIGRLPAHGDAVLYGEHEIRDDFYGFHIGSDHDLRLYVATNQPARNFLGGVYKPLLSVGLEGSTIRLAEEVCKEQLRELGSLILGFTADAQDELLSKDVDEFFSLLEASKFSTAEKLQTVSDIVAGVDRNVCATPQITDSMLEYVKKSLRMDVPQIVHASAYQVTRTDDLSRFKLIPGPIIFDLESLELGIVESPDSQGIAVMFMSEESSIQVPAKYISKIEHHRGRD